MQINSWDERKLCFHTLGIFTGMGRWTQDSSVADTDTCMYEFDWEGRDICNVFGGGTVQVVYYLAKLEIAQA